MGAILYPLFGAALTAASSIALGMFLLRKLGVELYRMERWGLAFTTGSACLSGLVLALSALHLARKGVFYGLAVSAVALAWSRKKTTPLKRSASIRPWLTVLFFAVISPFAAMYLFTAWAPEVSPDGSTYHLGNVLQFWAHDGLVPIRDMYGALPEGLEMLFLFAFAIGRHPSAALVHLSFLPVLLVLLISYSRRFGFSKAGFLAAVLVFASPIVGKDAASAYNDVALATVMFSVFYVVQIWLDRRDDRLLIAAGLLAGFCFGIKYTGFTAILYALVLIAGRLVQQRGLAWRPLLLFTAPCVILVAPWLLKNAIYMHNPVSPFFNRIFPNPYVSPKFETEYTQSMATYAGTANVPELALLYSVSGKDVGGFFGPLFLLAPLSLVNLGSRQGRHLLLAATLFGLPILSNGGTRFLIPAVPCLALAIAMSVADTKLAIPGLMVLHAAASWPGIAAAYCDRYAWRLKELPVRAALDPKADQDYLHENLDGRYDMARLLEQQTPAGSKTFCFSCPAQAYSVRETAVAFASMEGNAFLDMLSTPMEKWRQPVKRVVLSFPRTAAARLRVERLHPKATEVWQIAEFRVLESGRELPRSPQWRIRAHPDPWEAPFAFDNSPVSKWSTEQYGARGAFLELDFGEPTAVDSVLLECGADAPEELTLAAEVSPGHTVALHPTIRAMEVTAPTGMRRAAVRMLESYGFSYLVMTDRDFYADDYKKYPAFWGIRAVAHAGGWTLYRLE